MLKAIGISKVITSPNNKWGEIVEVNFEYINPFDERYDYMMRIEHLGRYYFASDRLKNFKKVLDVACADGYGTKILSQSIAIVDGIDRNEEYLRVARTKYNSNNINYKCIDVDNKVITGTYDGIVCFETLEHLKYPKKFLHNLYDILNNKGVMILSIPNSDYEIIENGKNKDSFHLHVFKYDDIVKMLYEIGFRIDKVLGQSYINKIVNKEIKDYRITNIIDDAKTIAYPKDNDIKKTYSYIFVLNKGVDFNEWKWK